VGVTVRRSTFSGGKMDERKCKRYLKNLADIIDLWIDKEGIPVVIFSQTISQECQSENDLALAKELHLLIKNKDNCIIVTDNLPIQVLRPLYAKARIFLGSRLHSVIFALLEGVPCVALEDYFFGPKTIGIMNDLGLGKFVFSVDTLIPDAVVSAMTYLDQNRSQVSSLIKNNVRSSQVIAQETIRFIDVDRCVDEAS
jgi:colanic acid/amylovoran biosynthesis protein